MHLRNMSLVPYLEQSDALNDIYLESILWHYYAKFSAICHTKRKECESGVNDNISNDNISCLFLCLLIHTQKWKAQYYLVKYLPLSEGSCCSV